MSFLQVALYVIAAERQVHVLRIEYFKALMRQELGWFDLHKPGDLANRLSE